ncbi:MAG: hypothetical protein E5X11_12900 [Mesorhizobium sp.]|nr:MAG: hypothetical protein E5X11_12900 [Mesorhizobium sp.]
MVLNGMHGHRPGKLFTVVAQGLIDKGHLPLQSKSRIYRDVLVLVAVGLLQVVRRGRRSQKEPNVYRLCLPDRSEKGEV